MVRRLSDRPYGGLCEETSASVAAMLLRKRKQAVLIGLSSTESWRHEMVVHKKSGVSADLFSCQWQSYNTSIILRKQYGCGWNTL